MNSNKNMNLKLASPKKRKLKLWLESQVLNVVFYSILAESPAIRSVSNGASIYSVMYAGSGNKITIKRKAAATEGSSISPYGAESTQQGSGAGSIKCISASQMGYGTSSTRKSSKSSKVFSLRIEIHHN